MVETHGEVTVDFQYSDIVVTGELKCGIIDCQKNAQ